MDKRTQAGAFITLLGRLKYTGELANNLAKEFTGRPQVKSFFLKVSNRIKSLNADISLLMSKQQYEAFRELITEDRTAQMENIVNLLQFISQEELDKIENTLIEINKR